MTIENSRYFCEQANPNRNRNLKRLRAAREESESDDDAQFWGRQRPPALPAPGNVSSQPPAQDYVDVDAYNRIEEL